MTDEADIATATAELAEVIADMPAHQRAAVPTNDAGKPQVEIVRALYQYANPKPGEVTWIEVRELSIAEWEAVVAAHANVYRLTRGLDAFPSFAWGDLQNARDELLRQLREQTWPNEWMGQLIEHRILNFSTALKLYHAHVTAQVNRIGDGELKDRVASAFSETYDRNFGYRLIYSMRNAFQHGVRDLLSLQMTARLAKGSEADRESEVHAYLKKDAFAASRSNATVRQQVRDMDDDIDLFELGKDAFAAVEMLHARLAPLIHPGASAAARLITQYIKELDGERPHFHEYIRGLPTKGILGTTTLDRVGFDYVVKQVGGRATYDAGSPPDVLAVLPNYPTSGHSR
ncbi:hypothetical protein [Cryobacterium sp. Y62]|uniref:hypothetical protein n=1 Tax=Cryobacterium sp. Y62 TaxID=2048284 RepID=UPI000CE55C75|nr:hypothetical protein [Cryobacterium sp. Y62]